MNSTLFLSEMVRQSQTVPDPTKGHGEGSALHPRGQNLCRAVPHVRNMVAAMRKRDRAAALKSGQEALVEMIPAR
jgi:hypothetical protein